MGRQLVEILDRLEAQRRRDWTKCVQWRAAVVVIAHPCKNFKNRSAESLHGSFNLEASRSFDRGNRFLSLSTLFSGAPVVVEAHPGAVDHGVDC